VSTTGRTVTIAMFGVGPFQPTPTAIGWGIA
jgi:hypothetical protein